MIASAALGAVADLVPVPLPALPPLEWSPTTRTNLCRQQSLFLFKCRLLFLQAVKLFL